MTTDEEFAKKLRAFGASVDAACNAGLAAGLTVDQIGFVLASCLGTCAAIATKDDATDSIELIAERTGKAVQKVVLERIVVERGHKAGEKYRDERFCDHCDTDTMHDVIDSTHERDSSGDWGECLVCHYWFTGFDREYRAPGEI